MTGKDITKVDFSSGSSYSFPKNVVYGRVISRKPSGNVTRVESAYSVPSLPKDKLSENLERYCGTTFISETGGVYYICAKTRTISMFVEGVRQRLDIEGLAFLPDCEDTAQAIGEIASSYGIGYFRQNLVSKCGGAILPGNVRLGILYSGVHHDSEGVGLITSRVNFAYNGQEVYGSTLVGGSNEETR